MAFTNHLVFLDAPSSALEFSIDGISAQTGPRFEGIKNIPDGFHLVAYRVVGKESGNGEGPLTGILRFYNDIDDKGHHNVEIFKWNRESEQFVIDSKPTLEQIQTNLPQLSVNMGDYEMFMAQSSTDSDTIKRWKRLTSHISKETLERIFPGADNFITPMTESYHGLLDLKEDLKIEAGLDEAKLHFTRIGELKELGVTGAELTALAMDKSPILKQIISDLGCWQELLAELQFTFILLVFGENFEGFQQWMSILGLLANSPSFSIQNSRLLKDLLVILRDQLSECPREFFDQVVLSSAEHHNKLYKFLLMIVGSARDCGLQEVEGERLLFCDFLGQRFGWIVGGGEDDDDGDLDLEIGEDAPVIVEE